MGIHVEIAEAVVLARSLGLDIEQEVVALEQAMAVIGQRLAVYFDVALVEAEVQEPGFAGACVSFTNKPGNDGRVCPPELQAMDTGGSLG